jgi:DNA-nicking Smr family endonuclease
MVGRVRRRFPSQEELELWAKVTRHDEPLARRRRPAPHDPATEAAPAAIPPKPAESLAKDQDASSPPVAKPSGIARNRPIEPPPPQPFDPRAAQRIARGRREIDARLDLHGMRQSDAHAALRAFLARCQAEGYRHVLIITGKGINLEADERRDFWTSERRGVLRRLVPHWLSEPSMRTHVVSFTESAVKHGGSGALYVTIRKGPRSRS